MCLQVCYDTNYQLPSLTCTATSRCQHPELQVLHEQSSIHHSGSQAMPLMPWTTHTTPTYTCLNDSKEVVIDIRLTVVSLIGVIVLIRVSCSIIQLRMHILSLSVSKLKLHDCHWRCIQWNNDCFLFSTLWPPFFKCPLEFFNWEKPIDLTPQPYHDSWSCWVIQKLILQLGYSTSRKWEYTFGVYRCGHEIKNKLPVNENMKEQPGTKR